MIPGKLYKKARIRGEDGFVMLRYVFICDKENFVSLMEKLNADIDCSNWSNKQFRYADARLLEKQLIKYLKPFCSDSFGVGSQSLMPEEEDDWKTKIAFYIAFRSKKDLFKFNMKFGGMRRRWWRSQTNFTIVATADDPYVVCHAGEKWNKEDPHGYLRP